MSGSYAYTPPIWPSFLTVLLLVALAIFSWRRHAVPGARVFAVSCLLAVPWAAGSVMEAVAVDAADKIFWFKFQSVWQIPVATALTCFVLEYAWPGRWLTRRNLALLSIPPLLLLGLALTNDLHHLLWRGFMVDGTVIPLRGPANWACFAYGYGMAILAVVVFAWLFVRSPRHRWPVAFMLTGQMVGRVVFLLEAAQVLPSGLLFNVPPIAFEYGMYAIALFGFRIFEPIRLARQAVIVQMREGVLVLDPEGRVAGLNPAAERILRLPEKQAMGQAVRDLLPAYPDGLLADPAGAEIELSLPEGRQDDLKAGQEVRQYMLGISPLEDWRGLEVGRLLLLRDVTEQKRAQAQLLEQQWAQATLQERELLAQELHDGLAQNLGFLNLQAQAAYLYLRSGQGEAAQDSLDRLTQVALDMQGDTRELIGNLLTVSLPSEGLCSVVRQAVARFEKQTGLPVSLEIPDDLPAVCSSAALPPATGVQVLRILQEVLANVRKHAGCPTQVAVRLSAEGGQLQMTIADNGTGFDPALASAGAKHFGLQVMAQRAERIGGQMAVHSAPGSGTRVEVCVPLASGGPGREP
jgi:signal transduction histidine kinase